MTRLAKFNQEIRCGFHAKKGNAYRISIDLFHKIRRDMGEDSIEWAPDQEPKKETPPEKKETAAEVAASRQVPGAPDIVEKTEGEGDAPPTDETETKEMPSDTEQ